MRVRDSDQYSNGASVHYGGTNDMITHWAARPHLYKASIIYTDDYTVSSTYTESALEINSGKLGRQFSISYQGTGTCSVIL